MPCYGFYVCAHVFVEAESEEEAREKALRMLEERLVPGRVGWCENDRKLVPENASACSVGMVRGLRSSGSVPSFCRECPYFSYGVPEGAWREGIRTW